MKKNHFIKGTEVKVPMISKEEIIKIIREKNVKYVGKVFSFEGKTTTFRIQNGIFTCIFDGSIPEWYVRKFYS